MHYLFHNMLELLPCFVSSLVSVVMFYLGFTIIDMIGANHKNTILGEWGFFFFFRNLKTDNSLEGPLEDKWWS